MTKATPRSAEMLALVAEAMITYHFRAPRVGERAADYLAALIDHVQSRDLAAGHELRLGKRQADWTPAEGLAFSERMRALPGPREDGIRGRFTQVRDPGPYDVTEAQLITLARRGITALVKLRERKPHREVPIFGSVLLTTGAVITTSMKRDDRIAVLKHLARTEPVFGFFNVFDAYLHQVHEGGRATKQDGIMANVGTREMRRTLVQPYHYAGNIVVLDEALPDIDFREPHVEAQDPYASIFVSVPLPTAAPS